MADPVTDPDLIARLEAQAQPPPLAEQVPVTDPALIARLEAQANPQSPSFTDQLKHTGAMAGRAITTAVGAVPLMAEDFGVGARNLYEGLTGGSYHQYDYPSDTYRAAQDALFGKPQGTAEKIEDVGLPMAMSAGASSAKVPALIRTLMAPTPSAGTSLGGAAGPIADVPQNFMTGADSKRQLLAQTLQQSSDAGYVVPPATTNPTVKNHLIETLAGKIATQQGAAIANQPVTNRLAATSVGLNPDAPITVGALKGVRAEAAQGYAGLRRLGDIETDSSFWDTLNQMRGKYQAIQKSFPGTKSSPVLDDIDSLDVSKFDSSAAVDKISALRDKASAAFKAGENTQGADYKSLATALENQIDRSASANPDIPSDAVAKFRASRQLIAKTHSVEDALNEATGDVSATKLANSGDPLSGELATIANFAKAAPKAVQDAAKIGSHGVSHLDTMGTMIFGGLGEHATGSGWGLAAGAAYPIARSGAKAYALGPGQAGAFPQITPQMGSPKSAAAIAQALKTFSP